MKIVFQVIDILGLVKGGYEDLKIKTILPFIYFFGSDRSVVHIATYFSLTKLHAALESFNLCMACKTRK